jgi:hypothetical protein
VKGIFNTSNKGYPHNFNISDEIKFLDPLQVRSVIGKIIPAVLSTTSVVAGLAAIEVLKLSTIKLFSNGRLSMKPKIFSKLFSILPFVKQNRIQAPTTYLLGVNAKSKTLFRNSFINLGTPSFASIDLPDGTLKYISTTGETFSQWDYVLVRQYPYYNSWS